MCEVGGGVMTVRDPQRLSIRLVHLKTCRMHCLISTHILIPMIYCSQAGLILHGAGHGAASSYYVLLSPKYSSLIASRNPLGQLCY